MDQYFFKTAFGVSGDVAAIPRDLQPGGSMSYTEGFPYKYGLPNSDPDRKKVPRDQSNQLYLAITENIQQYQTYGTPEWITAADNDAVAYSYSIGARVKYSGAVWVSIAASNTAEPGTDLTKWRLAATVETRGGSFGGIVDVSATPYAVIATNFGYQHILSGSAAVVNMCAIAGASIGDSFPFVNFLSTKVLINRDGSSTFTGTNGINSSSTVITVPPYSAVIITKETASTWSVQGIGGSQDERVLAAGSLTTSITNLDFALETLDPDINAGNVYEVSLDNFQPNTDQNLVVLQVSSDNASTFVSTGYEMAGYGFSSNGNGMNVYGTNRSYAIVCGTGTTGAAAGNDMGSAANEIGDVFLRLKGLNTGVSRRPTWNGQFTYYRAQSDDVVIAQAFGGSQRAAATYNGFRLKWQEGGTFANSGTYVLRKKCRGI